MVHALPKQNHKFHVVLLAGGPRDLAREIRNKLANSRDIFVKYHYEYDKERQWDRPIPKDVDFVIVLKDIISHSLFDKIKGACRVARIRWIVTQRKMATMMTALRNHGIYATDGLPVEISSVAYFNDDEPVTAAVAPVEHTEFPYPIEQKLAPHTAQETGKVTILVTPTPVPEGTSIAPRRGCPRPETMVLISALHQMAQDDLVSIMITPTGITVEPAK